MVIVRGLRFHPLAMRRDGSPCKAKHCYLHIYFLVNARFFLLLNAEYGNRRML